MELVECLICFENLNPGDRLFTHNKCWQNQTPCVPCTRPVHLDCMTAYIKSSNDPGPILCPSCNNTELRFIFFGQIIERLGQLGELLPDFTESEEELDEEPPPRRILTIQQQIDEAIMEGINNINERTVLVFGSSLALILLGNNVLINYNAPPIISIFYVLGMAGLTGVQVANMTLRGGGQPIKTKKITLNNQQDTNDLIKFIKENRIIYCVLQIKEQPETLHELKKISNNSNSKLVEIDINSIGKKRKGGKKAKRKLTRVKRKRYSKKTRSRLIH